MGSRIRRGVKRERKIRYESTLDGERTGGGNEENEVE